jgi:preprotein translocase subunit SecA
MRQNMLQVIGGLWVEYLTSVEALRTSIGLEAYAQRDPLVAYKSKAFEMFQELLVNMRAGVISRAFRISFQAPEPAAPAKRERAPVPAEKLAAEASPSRPESAGEGGGRRHRKKR